MKTIQNIFTLAAISSLGIVGCSSDRSAADYQTHSSEEVAADVNTFQTTAATDVPSADGRFPASATTDSTGSTVDTTTQQEDPTSGALVTSPNATTVRGAQEALNRQGYTVRASGEMDPNTTTAIRRFQAQKGLSETGTLNQETIDALQINQGRQPASVPSRTNQSTTPTR